MKKCIVLITLFSLILTLFTGCVFIGVSQQQLESDLITLPEVQECYKSDYVSSSQYSLKECIVNKEQLNADQKEDLILGTITVENSYFVVTLSFDTRYVYYDKGGWTLDTYNFELTNVYAIKEPDIDNLVELIEDRAHETHDGLFGYQYDDILAFYYDGDKIGYLHGGELKIDSCQLNPDKKSCLINVSYNSKNVSFKGTYQLWLSEKGWTSGYQNEPLKMTEYNYDFSNAVGTFICKNTDKITYQDDEIVISNMKDNSLMYVFKDRHTFNVREDEQDVCKILEFDPMKGAVCVGKVDNLATAWLGIDEYYWLAYDGNTDTWYNRDHAFGNKIYERA